MRMVDIIIKKRDGAELTTEELNFFVSGYVSGEVPDYQASSFAMAVFFNGMTSRETTDFTLAIVQTGEQLDLRDVVEIAVDKHSTGGVGDKTSLVVGPMVAACGLPVGKMSGRGLGFSGGTLDKMESISGLRTDLSTVEFLAQLKDIGIVIAGQTGDLAPADGQLYALRDVTGTVPSLPLIASSIMSKKLAAGAQRIVLDVKTGVGAFMETQEQAEELAQAMVDIGHLAGRETVALISDMNQPLGVAVGNALEVKEAIETLQGGGPKDFRDHCLEVAAHMLVLGGISSVVLSAREIAAETLINGSALEKFQQLISAQGGDISYLEDLDLFPKAEYIESVSSRQKGYLAGIHARIVGETAVSLGAGRETKKDKIDMSVGIEILRNVGDAVSIGDPLFVVHANHPAKLAKAKKALFKAHTWSDQPVEPLPLFYGVVK